MQSTLKLPLWNVAFRCVSWKTCKCRSLDSQRFLSGRFSCIVCGFPRSMISSGNLRLSRKCTVFVFRKTRVKSRCMAFVLRPVIGRCHDTKYSNLTLQLRWLCPSMFGLVEADSSWNNAMHLFFSAVLENWMVTVIVQHLVFYKETLFFETFLTFHGSVCGIQHKDFPDLCQHCFLVNERAATHVCDIVVFTVSNVRNGTSVTGISVSSLSVALNSHVEASQRGPGRPTI